MSNSKFKDTRFLVRVAVLGAMGFALMYVEFPLPFLPPFLKYDFGDLPPLIASFALGPLAGFLSSLIKVVIFFLSGKGDAGLIGSAANLVAGGTLTVVAGLVYRQVHSSKGALLGLAAGTLAMMVVTSVANILVFLPLWGVPAAQVMPLVLGGTLPFNLVKGLLTSVVTLVLYKRVRKILK